MTICKHLEWLQVTSEKELALINPGRMTRIVGELTNPVSQQPSILLFIGRKAKNLALRELFPKQIKKGSHDGIVTLRVDNRSLYSDHPVLFAESDPSVTIPSVVNNTSCHETEASPIRWAKATTVHNIYDILYGRLFCLFADVLCIFADDFINFESVVDRLKAWAAAGSGSTLFKQTRPRVVIVKRGDEASPSPTYDLLEMEDSQSSLQQKVLRNFYSSITVLHLADEQISPLARFRRLQELLRRQMDEMRQVRQSNGCLYSAIHLNKFFQMAVSHTAASILQPFNFVIASRENNEVGSDHTDHVTSFLRLGTRYKLSYDALTGFIASSILLDAYPPGMHKFNPKTLYEAIYHRSCFKSLMGSFMERSFAEHLAKEEAKEQEQCIEKHLVTFFSDMISSGKTAAQMHQEKAGSIGISWSQLKSNNTCLCCLRRKPENTLSCGHALCDVCVRIYGDEMPIMECQYHIGTCLLCHFGNRTVRLKPFSAGDRIISIDGGGTRGVIPLEKLAIIQDIMGPELELQDLFDIAFGTSVGGLIVCILFLRCVPVAQCVQIFDTLARKLFERPQGRRNIITKLRLFLKGWYSDGHYDVTILEDYLKENLGIDDRMFGYQPGILATKVGVVAATIGKASPIIFTNYNGSGTRKETCGYMHIRPEAIEDEPCIWEAGRGTSAAPVFYRSAHIKASGPVQDGGMSGHNNPVRPALSERLRNDPSLLKPDIVVSLGTGTQRASVSPRAIDFRHVILDGYVPRLWRSYMSSFNGQKIWEELMNSLDERNQEDYIRLNVFLPSDEPAIDNIDRMDELRKSVHIQPRSIEDCEKTLHALIVSAFYFELSNVPEFIREGRYHCRGTIRCRLQGKAVVDLLTRCHKFSLVFVTDVEALGYYGGDLDLCISCHRYQKNIDFFVRHPTEMMTIYVQSVTQGRRKISAFPQNMQWFKDQQKLEAQFGTAYHRDLQHRSCKTCFPNSLHQNSTALKRRKSDDQVNFRVRKKPRLQLGGIGSLPGIPENSEDISMNF